MKPLRVLAVVCSVGGLLCAVGGCVMPDELSRMQKDVADVQQQLRSVERTQSDLETKLDEERAAPIEVGETLGPADLADVELRLDQFSRQMAVAIERMRDIEQRLDLYSQDLQQTRELARHGSSPQQPGSESFGTEPPGALGPSASGTPEAFPDPEELYNTAYADFSKGNYALAISGFKEYQQRFPDSALADNALYWIAECDFSQGEYRSAVDALDDLLDEYPQTDKAPAANLKKALAFQEQNQIGQAIIQYRYVVSAFPDTDESRLARDKLAGLGASPN
jgi:tol-pal system protein YbgF